MRSFSVLAINSTCVSLSWTLLDNSTVPLFMVVQWSPLRQQDSDHHKGGGDTWARLPYTDRPIYLRGNMVSSLDFFNFSSLLTVNSVLLWYNMVSIYHFRWFLWFWGVWLLFVPCVCWWRRGANVHYRYAPVCTSFLAAVSVSYLTCLRVYFLTVTATRGDPAVYMMLMIISFLSIVLFVTLVLSQNQ